MANSRSSAGTPCPFGKYELLERIGSGGMAEVFRARLPGVGGFEKIVVIKRLHPHLHDDANMVTMFIEEAKLAAQVHHKNVVQVQELDRLDNGSYYMVLEYVQGTDLRRLLQHSRRSLKRIPPWLSVHIAIEVLDALIFAHDLVDSRGRRRNIVHRDVSPDNVFISDQGDIKIGDFGVAKDDTRPDPYAGQAKGKISYMAPEQLAGLSIDERYDVFAMGVVLWESLTQRPLFRGQTPAETMSLVLNAPRLAPSQFAQRLPRELDLTVLRALRPDPADRFASLKDMQAALHEILPKLRTNVGPLEVRLEMDRLLGDFPETVEITDDLIVEEVDAEEEATTLENEAENDAGWDGTYAIINPRLRADDPRQKRAPTAETEDIIASHLVYEIPMPGGPGLVETGDIIKKKQDASARAPSATPVSGSRVWEPYTGKYRFWMRSLNQDGFGPCSLADLLSMLRSRIPEAARRTLELSGDGIRWLPLGRFVDRVQLHSVEHEGQLPEGAPWGAIENPGIIPLFGRIAQHRPTGRLILIQNKRTPAETIEVHLVRGAPTIVANSDVRLSTPQQLIAQRVVDNTTLEECFHDVVLYDRPLDEVMLDKGGPDLAAHRVRFMVARLEPLMIWPSATFAITTAAPVEVEPFAPSMLALLPPLVHRTKSVEELRSLLGSALEAPYERAQNFDQAVRAFSLTAAQVAGINPLGQTRNIEEALRCSVAGEKFALTMAYILVQLGLLRPRSRTFSPI